MEQFKHPVLGEGEIDSFGVIWFPISKFDVNQYEAIEHAKSLNLRLATIEEMEQTILAGFSLGTISFWSSTHTADPKGYVNWGFFYNHRLKYPDDDYSDYGHGNARCVTTNKELHSLNFNKKIEDLL